LIIIDVFGFAVMTTVLFPQQRTKHPAPTPASWVAVARRRVAQAQAAISYPLAVKNHPKKTPKHPSTILPSFANATSPHLHIRSYLASYAYQNDETSCEGKFWTC